MGGIAAWLQEIGLEKYAALFAEKEITRDVCRISRRQTLANSVFRLRHGAVTRSTSRAGLA